MNYKVVGFMIFFLNGSESFSQTPVEVFGGHKKVTVDILFFKYFQHHKNENSKFLFFNRTRASIDYRQTSSTFLPTFGFTQAISYNLHKLKGFAPVAVVQIFQSGVFPKVGIQYFHHKNSFTFFSWLVAETMSNPYIDFFILTRFEPRLSDKLNIFAQLELVNAFPTEAEANYSFIQRLRLGLKIRIWQFGLGADFNESGIASFTNTNNLGVFLRHEFN